MYPSTETPTHGIFIHNEVKALQMAGVEVRVVSPVPWAPRVLHFRPKWAQYARIRRSNGYGGIPLLRYGFAAPPFPLNAWAGLLLAVRLLPALIRLRRMFPFDIIHTHTLTPDGLAGGLLANHFNRPSVCTVRGSDLNAYPYYSQGFMIATRQALRNNDAIITTSGALARAATRLDRRCPPPQVIYKGVNTAIFRKRHEKRDLRKKLGIDDRGPVLIFVGRLERDKGIFELLETFRRLKSVIPGLALVLVGDGSCRDRFARALAESDVADAATLTGRVPPARVADYLSAADIFVLPSYAEGMPNALLEAMAAGLPCIATAVGGNPEALQAGVSGILVPPKDVHALEQTITRILRNPDLGARLSSEAAKRIRSRFSWRANAEANLAVYQRLLRRKVSTKQRGTF